MNDSKLIPSFRFVEFKEGYTKNKLKELASFLKGKGYSKNDIVNYGFPIILYGRMYTNYRLNIKFINDTFVKNDKNSVKSVEGDVIIPASGETAEDISVASNIKRSGIIIGGDLNIIRPDNKLIDSSFLALVLSNGKVKQKIAKRAQGKSIVHIHNTDLMSLEIYFPSLNEQQKIGDFFSKLDKLLDLLQQKIDKLELLKKALLQKLFPKHDAKIPEFRFKGFEGDWRSCDLGKIAKLYQPKTITQKQMTSEGYPVFGANGFIGFYGKKNHSTDQVTISARGENAGVTSYVFAPVWITGNSMVINVDKNADIDKHFLFFDLSLINLKKFVTGGAQPQLTGETLRRVKIIVTKIKEQQKIGNFLSKVDQIIELENKKLQDFQQVKKCLLQNMFVE